MRKSSSPNTMPKSERSQDQNTDSMEMRLVELVREKPELYDPGHHHYKDSNRKRIIWEHISEELNIPVETLKKLWKRLRYNYMKKWRSDVESTDEKTTRSALYDQALTFLMTSVMEYGDENSCGNSVLISQTCDTEKDQRRLRSSSHLTSISEEDSSTSTLVPEDDSGPPLTSTGSLSLENFGVSKTSDRVLRPRHSEPSRLASRESLRPELVDAAWAGAPRRLTTTPTTPTPTKRSRNRRLILDPNNSTRVFFNSMAITVSSFPQYLQAIVKLQICKIVSDTECELYSPKKP